MIKLDEVFVHTTFKGQGIWILELYTHCSY
jgi:hypothetical protein